MRSVPVAVAAPSKAEFLKAVKDHLGAHKPMEFARALGLGPDGYQKVNRWNKGGRLDYEDTMRMLERCGWLNITEDAQPKDAPDVAGTPLGRLEEIAATLASLSHGQKRLLEHFGLPQSGQAQSSAQPEPQPVPAKRKAGKKRR